MERKKVYKYITVVSIVILLIIIGNLKVAKDIFCIFLFSIFMYYILKPIQKYLISKGINKKIASGIVLFFMMVIIIGILFYTIPKLFTDGVNIKLLDKQIQIYINKLYKKINSIKNYNMINILVDKVIQNVNILVNKMQDVFLKKILNCGSVLVDLAIMPIIVYYFLAEGTIIINKFIIIVPIKFKKLIKNILKDLDEVLGRYISSQVLLSTIIALGTFIPLFFLKIDFPFILSILNGIFNIVPYFGPILGALPILIVALLTSSKTFTYTLIFLILLQQIEGNIISPKVTGKSVNMHPLTVIILLTIGGKLYGFLGMIIAVPIGVTIKIIYENINYFIA